MLCPECGQPLENTEVEANDFEGDTYYNYCYGFCFNCRKMYTWTDVFTYDHTIDVEEINNDD